MVKTIVFVFLLLYFFTFLYLGRRHLCDLVSVTLTYLFRSNPTLDRNFGIFITILFHFFFSNFHQTSWVGAPGGPYYTDPVSVTLTYFSRSQTHLSAEITKLKIVITLLFLAKFWSNVTGMDPRSTPSL